MGKSTKVSLISSVIIMGGTPSKYEESIDGRKASFSRMASAPVRRSTPEEESSTKASWKSRLYSLRQSHNRERVYRFDVSKLKPVKEDGDELDFEHDLGGLNRDDYVNGHGKEGEDGSPSVYQAKNGSFLNRCITFQPVAEAECQRRCVSSRKISSHSVSSRALMDQDMGLRVLLSPPPSSSQSLVSSNRDSFPPERSLTSKGSFNSRQGNEFTNRAFSRVSMDDTSLLEPQWMTAATETEVPLFDPSILSTFEKAVEDMAQSTRGSAPVVAPERTLVSPEKSKDAGAKLVKGRNTLSRLKSLRSRAARDDRCDDTVPQLRTFPFLNRKQSFSKVLSLKYDGRDSSIQAYLDQFPRMCPSGCEGKIVLYFTSLRGVRKTFENCYMLRLILQGFRVHVDERDVWMHSKFRQELTDVMGAALSVPRLFILGRYIGGAEEVEVLHEEGILSKLLEGLPRECRKVCDVCADVRFIPCTACSGSRKIVISNDVTGRCSKCNENGLIMCPLCD